MGKANPTSTKNADGKVIAKKKATTVKHATPCAGGAKASGALLTILNVAAAQKLRLGQDSIDRKTLPALTGIHGKSTIANALTKIKNNNWMVVTPQEVTITEAGVKAADAEAVQAAMQNIPTTNAEYRQSVQDQHKLKAKAVELINYIQDGASYEKEDVANHLGLKINSTFSNLLTPLKKLEIIEFDRRTIRLTDKMFPFEPRVE